MPGLAFTPKNAYEKKLTPRQTKRMEEAVKRINKQYPGLELSPSQLKKIESLITSCTLNPEAHLELNSKLRSKYQMSEVDQEHASKYNQLEKEFSLKSGPGLEFELHPELDDKQRQQIATLLTELRLSPSLTNDKIDQAFDLIHGIKKNGALKEAEFEDRATPILKPELNHDQVDYLTDLSSTLLLTADLADLDIQPKSGKGDWLAHSVEWTAQREHLIPEQRVTSPELCTSLIAMYGLVSLETGGYAAVVQRNEGNRLNMPDFNPYDGRSFIDQVNKINYPFGDDSLGLEAKALEVFNQRPGIYENYYAKHIERPDKYAMEHTPTPRPSPSTRPEFR